MLFSLSLVMYFRHSACFYCESARRDRQKRLMIKARELERPSVPELANNPEPTIKHRSEAPVEHESLHLDCEPFA